MSKIPFGLKNGRMYEPGQVNRGLKCDCVCPECGERLVAKHGNKVIKYFAHYSRGDCTRSRESSIHKAAKQILMDSKELLLPGIYIRKQNRPINRYRFIEVIKEIRPIVISFESVVEESRVHKGVVPDIEAFYKGNQLFIEFAYTHFVDEEKYQKLIKLGIATLEIDLSKLSAVPSMEELGFFLIKNNQNRKWIFNPKILKLEDKATEELNQKEKEAELEKSRYCALTNSEKLELELKPLGIKSYQLPKPLNLFVPGHDSFKVTRNVWQAALYREFIHEQQGNNIEHDDVCDWLGTKFKIYKAFHDADKIAVWKYLVKLSELGFLKRLPSKAFYVAKDLSGKDTPY